MHRIFHILLSFTLILATTGLSISKHYCGSSVVKTNLGTQAESCMPDMDMGHGCCDEKTETIILDDDFQLSNSNIKIAPEYDLLVAYLVSELRIVTQSPNPKTLIPLNTGPPVGTEPLYLKVQSFLL